MNVLVIGGGAAGMMAAAAASEAGADVILAEKNEKLGKKIYITGKGRCNFTNACLPDDFLANVTGNPRFMYSSFGAFDNRAVMDYFEKNGLKIKVERGNRVFPLSDKASDVTRTLETVLRKNRVRIMLRANAKELLIKDGAAAGAIVDTPEGQKTIRADKVIVATGGLSYPSTGSDGDGYRFAKALGHRIVNTFPSLVSLCAKLPGDMSVRDMAGLSLKNVRLLVYDGKKKKYDGMGEMLFTHEGISGPIVLSLSAMLDKKYLESETALRGLETSIDWKPALSLKTLDDRLLRELDEAKNKNVKTVMRRLLPESAITALLMQAGVPAELAVHELTRQQRCGICNALKKFRLILTGLGGYNEAVVTRGGIDVKEIDPATMRSKLIPGLYFAGEVLDIDALTGGFNLQLAWSTGHAAGKGVMNE